MCDDHGNNLLNPGDTPHDNMQFLVFCAAVLRAVNKWQGLLRMSIASAGNDHRLGANEAPPAIISVFLGDMLTDIFEQIEKGGAKRTKQGGMLDTGVSVLPKLPRDAGDRNRTSPFAFTGNKFEFRAVSSGQSIAFPNICAERRGDRVARLRRDASSRTRPGKGKKSLEEAVKELLPKLIKENKRIIFNGNGYSDEWRKEAAKRGLLNLKNTVDALPELIKPDVVKTFEKYKVLNERELHARYEINFETYIKTINVEGQLMVLMANRYILPAALQYQKDVAESVAAVEGRAAARARKARSCSTRSPGSSTSFRIQHREARPRPSSSTRASAEKHAKYHARQRRAGDGRRSAKSATSSKSSSRTACGRCRRTGRCCSSSRQLDVTRTHRGACG